MALKDEIKQLLARKLYRKRLKEATWGELVQAVQAASPTQKAVILTALREGEGGAAGRALQDLLEEFVRDEVLTEADALLSDDQLTLVEIARVFGSN